MPPWLWVWGRRVLIVVIALVLFAMLRDPPQKCSSQDRCEQQIQQRQDQGNTP